MPMKCLASWYSGVSRQKERLVPLGECRLKERLVPLGERRQRSVYPVGVVCMLKPFRSVGICKRKV